MSGLRHETLGAVTRVPLRIAERHGVPRAAVDVRTGIPLPRGFVRDTAALSLEDASGQRLPHEFQALHRWPDGSLKWVLLDASIDIDAHAERALFVTPKSMDDALQPARMQVHRGSSVQVDSAQLSFEFKSGAGELFKVLGLNEPRTIAGVSLLLTDRAGAPWTTRVSAVQVERQGLLSTTVAIDGAFEQGSRVAPLEFRARITLHANVRRVRMDLQLKNPQAAHHAGGLWDLGDPGSWQFSDCSVRIRTCGEEALLQWSASPDASMQTHRGDWSLYQDSSGGERWDSINHVDANGRLTVGFRGYAVTGAQRTVIPGRAAPVVRLEHGEGWIAAAVPKFWQEFPKALRRRGSELEIGLFPRECPAGFELQGGERKRHCIVLEFGGTRTPSSIAGTMLPLDVAIDPQWIESTRAVPYFAAPTARSQSEYERYVRAVVEGPESFFAKRERIDEYGWRHFGDLYADHEAVKHAGSEPFVSHYNNQYDFIFGAAVHYLRSGDARWRELMEDAARHTLDIDIYHTQSDKPAFNGGLFWHTDHYVPAARSTHRTYSAANARDHGYGGGPSNEHNYTSGLLLYHCLSGDPEAKAAVLELADWVIAMDDGSRTLLSFVNSSPTGLASKTVDMHYHKPGRGAGNSINALLDAYVLSGRRAYLLKAEELVQRCIHPRDDVAALQLGEPEYRWSYLAFLQVLGKYLATKSELGERDYGYHYARESLLAYAEWMLAHEVPYRDVLDKVLIPTETWPAQDIRKAHVLYLAAYYGEPERRSAFHARAEFFFERCLSDLLSFKTAFLTRPLVLLCVYGYVRDYFENVLERTGGDKDAHDYVFGEPQAFKTQRQLLNESLRSRRGLLARDLQRLGREATFRIKRALRMRRGGSH